MSDMDDHSAFEDEGSGYLVSVSDIMAGLLFIFIITLVAFVIQFQDAEKKAKEIEQIRDQEAEQLRETTRQKEALLNRLTNNQAVRRRLLSDIERELRERGVRVTVDLELGVLRLTEQTVRFSSGKSVLGDPAKQNLRLIADVLGKLLPCYAAGGASRPGCDPLNIGKLEAVFIEGHTDNMPFPDRGYTNWDLSAKRAIVTYEYIIEQEAPLARLENSRGEPLFSVAGYAERRPLFTHDTPTDDERNRRIDMRFIMTPPTKKDAAIVDDIHRMGVN
ncbi:MAG: OmpA family protein [Chromatiales bacterium]|nr:OmpA family protein [Chromatiales bacterium]